MLLYYWYATCYIHLIGKFKSEVTSLKIPTEAVTFAHKVIAFKRQRH